MLALAVICEFDQDHMRKAGDVCFSQVFRDGRGTIFLDALLPWGFFKFYEFMLDLVVESVDQGFCFGQPKAVGHTLEY